MLMRIVGFSLVVLVLVAVAFSQDGGLTPAVNNPESGGWKNSNSPANESANGGRSAAGSAGLTTTTPVTLVNKGAGVLPNDHGQVWREYDISPYTSRVTNTQRPEQAVVDWILRDTGSEVWFSEPLGILNASKNTLRVYHTPEMQRLVLDIVDRFVSSQADAHAITMRLVAIGSPSWRTAAMPLMQPIDIKSAGVEAWLVSKENAAILLAQLRQRTDYREQNASSVPVHNGQSHTVTRTTPRSFVRSVRMRPDVWPGHELVTGQMQEGFTLQISPLMSLDGNTIDAVIKCEVDQIEKLVPVNVDVPSVTGGAQRVQVQVPQVISWRLHERFRWPVNQVLILGCGVVASPTQERMGPLGLPLPPLPFTSGGRADALLMVETSGKASQVLLEARQDFRAGPPTTNGRY
jgi:hypothetical protein